MLHIQRDRAVEAAIQRDFSQVLAISEKQINHKAYELVDDVRTDLPAPSEACGPTLDKILAAHPYAAHIFMFSPETGMVFRSQSDRLKNDQRVSRRSRLSEQDVRRLAEDGLPAT